MKLYFKYKFSFIFNAFTLLFMLNCKSYTPTLEEKYTMNSPKITLDDLEKTVPMSIKTAEGYVDMYAVIIYTEDAQALKLKGILVQTETSKFVTALIKKDDLKVLNTMESVTLVQLPIHDYPTMNDELN